jgi:hypothetical protein
MGSNFLEFLSCWTQKGNVILFDHDELFAACSLVELIRSREYERRSRLAIDEDDESFIQLKIPEMNTNVIDPGIDGRGRINT